MPKAHTAPVVNQRYAIVTKGGVVATDPPTAVVYLEGPFAKPAAQATAQMAQKDLAFVTPLLPVQVGTKVEFPNLDDTYQRPIPAQIFDAVGLVTLRCEIHEHMRGLILVLDTPHFTRSDTDGRYRLAGLPAGRYTLKAWTNSKTTLTGYVSGSKLWVRVRAINSKGKGPWSDPAVKVVP